MSTWVKLDDTMPENPKIIEAGPVAAWLYVCGLTYSSRNLTDGFIPAGMVRRLADIDSPDAVRTKLVEVGLWHPVDGGFKIHDYDEHQRTAAEIEAARAGARSRQRKHRERVTTVSHVTHSEVTAPETETETETKKEDLGATAPSAADLGAALDILTEDLLTTTFSGDPVGAFATALEAADTLAADHAGASPKIRAYLRNRVLGSAAVHFHELEGKDVGRLAREATALGDGGHLCLISTLASTASSAISGDAVSYVIAAARRTAAAAKAVS